MKNTLWIMFIGTGLLACSTLQRSAQSGYQNTDQTPAAVDFYQDRHSYEQDMAKEDLGIDPSAPLTTADREALESRMELNDLESRLPNQREKKQYYPLKGLMHDDNERVAFLRLPTIEARERYAQDHRLAAREQSRTPQLKYLIEKNDIALGMSTKSVQESWGDPEMIEASGNPLYGNQRWKYTRYVSGTEGYNKETRYVYFEAGRVVGWETI